MAGSAGISVEGIFNGVHPFLSWLADDEVTPAMDFIVGDQDTLDLSRRLTWLIPKRRGVHSLLPVDLPIDVPTAEAHPHRYLGIHDASPRLGDLPCHLPTTEANLHRYVGATSPPRLVAGDIQTGPEDTYPLSEGTSSSPANPRRAT